ncbi:hypothetical protein EV363DRAFT_1358466 [Boletus edulis]|nr:hypothetical protein EV363DRAFT_1358466 [Boletus edulis]
MQPARREDVHRSPPSNPRALPPVEPPAPAPPTRPSPPIRPSRAALGISRFGPPVVKEKTEPVQSQMNIFSESALFEHAPEGSSLATPPPPSRESSMVSVKDVAIPPDRPAHLPPRPASPSRGHRLRSGDTNKPLHPPNARSPQSRSNEVNPEAPARPGPPSPLSRKRAVDTYPSEPPLAPWDNRAAYSPDRIRPNLRDSEADHHVTRPLPTVLQNEDRERAPPPMHPERAFMLQANGLPPRPPSVLGRTRSGRGGFKRDRGDDHEHNRAEPLRGNSRGRYGSVSPERRRYPEDDRCVGYGGGAGASLLDRLTLDEGGHNNLPSLRDRVQLPSKRDREDMLAGDLIFDAEGNDYDASKRVRRRGIKVRKGRG